MNQAKKQSIIFAWILIALLSGVFSQNATAAKDTIIVVGDLASYDQQVVDFITSVTTGLNAEVLYTEDRYQSVVGDAVKIAELNAAKLIVFSRNAVSANYDDTTTSPTETTFWNSLPVPTLSFSMFQTRTGTGTTPRWHWVASNGNVATQLIDSMVVRPGMTSDTLFNGVTITSNTIQLFTTPQSLRWFSGQNIMANTNATSYLGRAPFTGPNQFSQDDGPFLVRWDNTALPYHSGTVQTPAAKRILFAIFDDTAGQTPASTPPVVQMNNLTADGKKLLTNILKELAPTAFDPPVTGPNASEGWTIFN